MTAKGRHGEERNDEAISRERAAIDQRGCERSEGMRAQRTQRTKERSMHVGMMMVFTSYGWENCRFWRKFSFESIYGMVSAR